MEIILIIAIIWYVLLLIMICQEGSNRKIGATTTFWVSLLFSPIFGLLFVIASERIEKKEDPLKLIVGNKKKWDITPFLIVIAVLALLIIGFKACN